jgi:prepilin-type N-terminal cleavage/methylation domain-containing protein
MSVAIESRDRRRGTRRPPRGYTLIELVVSLSILGILAGLAVPTFKTYTWRARRTEAIVGLGNIYRAQRAYFVEHHSYGDTFDEIGFGLEGGQRVDERTIRGRTYTFTVQALPLNGDPAGNFQAIATGDLDTSDDMLDVLLIENDLTIVK